VTRFDPDTAVRDPLGVRLRVAHQRREPGLEILCGDAIETMVNLAGVNKNRALEAAQV
jgi:hypothetical protein